MQRSAFTLIELMIVLVVIAALAALLIPAMGGALGWGTRQGTEKLVNTIATRIVADDSLFHTYLEPGDSEGVTTRKWDMNEDGLLDGYPDKVFDTTWQERAENVIGGEYRGFYGTLTIDAGDRFVNRMTGEIKDPWGEVIRIKFHPSDYGTEGFVVYSLGPDRKDGTDDDIIGRPEGEDD